ncbi:MULTISPECIES: AraC family transcriptional regulator [unclassified Microbacterium]|uniref:AraC family transcriptional regulator n=1 Tax=unclassified Microbacterium TaxID=2609290 RepID=UPI0020363A36|nr:MULTISPECIES: AraC family transcriptional regulator [unclassified Microbacterium]
MAMGVDAAEECDDFGWHPRGEIDPGLVAETTQHPQYGMGRAWSNSAGYNLTTAPERTYLVYTVEGGFEFDVDGKAVTAESDSLILLDGEAPTTAQTLTTTARFVWYFEPTFLKEGQSRFRFHEPISMRNASVRALLTMTNTVLNSPAPTSVTAQRHLGLALEHLVAGALDEAGSDEIGWDSLHHDGLFMAAQNAIESHFRNPGFDVARLARELSVSVRTVHNAFARFGTTPRREIERRRVTEIDRMPHAKVLPASQAAELAGFASAKQMNRALARRP